MKKPSRMAANLAAAVIVTSLFGTSAFAETRHRDEVQDGDALVIVGREPRRERVTLGEIASRHGRGGRKGDRAHRVAS